MIADNLSTNVWRGHQRAASVIDLTDPPYDDAYWLCAPPEERWEALELMRWMKYGQVACTGRVQRVIQVVPLCSK